MGMWDIPVNDNELEEGIKPEDLEKFISDIAVKIVRYNLSVPAIMMFELLKPLSFLSYNTLVFLSPMFDLFISPTDYSKFLALIKNQSNIEKLLVTIEKIEQEKSNNPNNDGKKS